MVPWNSQSTVEAFNVEENKTLRLIRGAFLPMADWLSRSYSQPGPHRSLVAPDKSLQSPSLPVQLFVWLFSELVCRG